jgi:amidase
MSIPQHEDLWSLSAGKLASLIRLRKVSALEVAQSALARLAAVNPPINAVIEHHPDDVLAQARAVDQAIARNQPIGPLAGVPVTIKLNVDQVGYTTSNGIRAQRDLIAKHNSPLVDNMIKAGAVLLGRTNAPAFCYRWFTSNLVYGATLNPHDATLTPGGSSGGAAAAVAAGIGAIAHGTDIAGSIRYPAYACGVHGLRPSLGRVATYNASAPGDRPIGGQIMAVSGPLARTVDDLRLALSAMVAPDPRDPWWTPAPLAGPDVPRQAAVCLRPDGMDTDPAICAALVDAADRLRDAGWVVDELDSLPPIQEAVAVQITLWLGDGYDAMVRAAEADGDPGAIAALAGQADFARSIGPGEFSAALSRRLGIARAWQVFLERYPVVLLPSSAELPFPNDLDLKDHASYQRVWTAQMTMIGLPVAGLPALSLCTGFQGHTPLGVQIVAGRFREDLCLAAGEAIESRGRPIRPVQPSAAP